MGSPLLKSSFFGRWLVCKSILYVQYSSRSDGSRLLYICTGVHGSTDKATVSSGMATGTSKRGSFHCSVQAHSRQIFAFNPSILYADVGRSEPMFAGSSNNGGKLAIVGDSHWHTKKTTSPTLPYIEHTSDLTDGIFILPGILDGEQDSCHTEEA